jgi:hypothetical protein
MRGGHTPSPHKPAFAKFISKFLQKFFLVYDCHMKTPKPKPKAKPAKPRKLTEKQKIYVNEKMMGRKPSVILGFVRDCDKSPKVQEELAEQQQLLRDETNLTRKDVVQGLLDAINRAKMQAEPATEIAGWKEVGRILGVYAPERKELVLSQGQDKVLRHLEALPTQELLEMVEKKRQQRLGVTLDGTATRLNH